MRTAILERGPELRRRILLLVVVLTPLLFLRNAYDPINVPKLTLVMTGTILVAGIRAIELLQGASAEGLRRLTVPVAAMGIPLLLAWALSPYRGWALFGAYSRFGGLIPYLVIFLFGVLIADSFPGRVEELGWGLLVAGGVAGGYSLIQVVGLDPFSWTIEDIGRRGAYSSLGNPNFAGAFFAMVLPVGLVLWKIEHERRKVILLLLGLTVVGWLSSLSEGGWGAGLAGSALTGGLLLAEKDKRWPLAGTGVGVTIALAALVVVPFAAMSEASFIPTTIDRRADWWATAASMAADSPALGRGPNAFAIEGVQHRTLEDALKVGYFSTNDPHSVYMSFLTGAGLLGLLGFVLAVGWTVRYAYRARRAGPLTAGFAGLLLAYLVQSFISIDTVNSRMVAWTGLGALVASTAQLPVVRRSATKRTRRVDARLKALPAVLVVLLLAGVLLWGTSRILVADLRFNAARDLMNEGQVEPARAKFESAISARSEPVYRAEYGREMGRVAVSLAGAERHALADRYLDYSRNAFAFTDELPQVDAIVSYARILQNWATQHPESQGEAIAQFRRALELDPTNPSLVAEAAHVALLFEMYDDAASIASSAAQKLDVAGLWGVLARAHAHLGNEEEAQMAIDRAIALDPSEAHALIAQDLLQEG